VVCARARARGFPPRPLSSLGGSIITDLESTPMLIERPHIARIRKKWGRRGDYFDSFAETFARISSRSAVFSTSLRWKCGGNCKCKDLGTR